MRSRTRSRRCSSGCATGSSRCRSRSDGVRMKMMMDGAEHAMLMPGMLTDDQMKQLDAARGKEFDRLFLTFMIQHHQGAVSMVKHLFGSYGAAQDETVFKFASDVNVDQTTEIARMEQMLASTRLETAQLAVTSGTAHTYSHPRNQSCQSVLVLGRLLRRRLAVIATGVRASSTSAATATPSPGRAASTARAEPRSARRTARRAVRTPAEAAWNLRRAVARRRRPRSSPGDHELRPRVHRQLRDSGQLQRLPGLGHLEPGASPTLKTAYFCPASQSDVSVYKNLLFVSGEGSPAASTAAPRA